MLKVHFHAATDLRDQREILMIRGTGGAVQRIIKPRGIVIEHLVGADLDRGAVADE